MKDSHIFFSAKPQNLSNTFIYFWLDEIKLRATAWLKLNLKFLLRESLVQMNLTQLTVWECKGASKIQGWIWELIW